MAKVGLKKRFNLIALLNVSTIPFVAITGCSHKIVLSWSGVSKSYTRNYDKYSRQSIRFNDIVNCYVNNTKFEQMISQDIIYNVNYLCTLYDKKMKIKYEMSSVSHTKHRISYRMNLFDQNSKLLLDLDVKNLSYSEYFNMDLNAAMLLVSNTVYTSSGWYTKEDFWLDDNFKIVLLSYNDGSLNMNYDFSWKNFDEEERLLFQSEFLPWLEIVPYFYDGVQVVE